jgi:HlyD family secretion protein
MPRLKAGQPFFYLTLALCVIALAAYGLPRLMTQISQATGANLAYSLVHPERAPLQAVVNASGAIQPRQIATLSFPSGGMVGEILVGEGAQAKAGQVLARLDTRVLQLDIEHAEAVLAQAQARYTQVTAAASPEEIAQAEATLNQTEGQLSQVRGAVTDADIAAAQAALDQARTTLAQLEAGPRAEDIAAAQGLLNQAVAELQTLRDQLSAAKTTAQSEMEQAANELRKAQDDYSRVYWRNYNLRQQDDPLPQILVDQENEAERDVENAAEALHQAMVAYESARQAESTAISAGEAKVQTAQANLDKLVAGATPEQLAAARAQVAQAEANLDKLQGEQRSGAVSAAAAAVDNAAANLERLGNGPRPGEVEAARAQIQQAQSALRQAQLALERTALIAPIDGAVTNLELTVGETLAPAQPVLTLVDLSGLFVEVTVDEIDVTQLSVGQDALLTIDALPTEELSGTIDSIGLLSDNQSGVTSYKVRVSIASDDPRVRPGMSTNVDIVVASKDDALVLPRRAVRADQGMLYVDIPTDQSLCDADPATWPEAPQLQALTVTVGLDNEQLIEIVSAQLSESSCVYVAGLDARLDVQPGQQLPSLRERRQRDPP